MSDKGYLTTNNAWTITKILFKCKGCGVLCTLHDPDGEFGDGGRSGDDAQGEFIMTVCENCGVRIKVYI
jgi:hypothetical protein